MWNQLKRPIYSAGISLQNQSALFRLLIKLIFHKFESQKSFGSSAINGVCPDRREATNMCALVRRFWGFVSAFRCAISCGHTLQQSARRVRAQALRRAKPVRKRTRKKSINQCTFLNQSNNEITFVISFYLLDLTVLGLRWPGETVDSVRRDEEFITSPNTDISPTMRDFVARGKLERFWTIHTVDFTEPLQCRVCILFNNSIPSCNSLAGELFGAAAVCPECEPHIVYKQSI